jgi:hypothetical protein
VPGLILLFPSHDAHQKENQASDGQRINRLLLLWVVLFDDQAAGMVPLPIFPPDAFR